LERLHFCRILSQVHGQRSNRMSILFKAFLVGTASLIAAVSMILIVVPLFGETYQLSMFVNAVIGCYSIGSPVSFYCMKQTQRYSEALNREEDLHQQLQDAHDQLQIRASQDMMTGLLNREAFLSEFEREKANHPNELFSVILLDVDRFKRINDTWGHHAGDQALISIAQAISEVSGPDIPTGRIGGEEFAIFLPQDDGLEANGLAEAIRVAVERIPFFPTNNNEVPLSLSVGVASAGKNVSTATLLRRADAMLYQAKAEGRNCVRVNKAPQLPPNAELPPLILQRRSAEAE